MNDELPEWEVTADPPVPISAASPQQAADERLRLEFETPPEPPDRTVKLWVRPAGTEETWQMVYPAIPPLTVDGGQL